MADCLFCRIAKGEIPAQRLYEDERAVAFQDLHPQAPLHALVVPRKHLASLGAASAEDEALVGHLLRVAAQVAHEAGFEETGYRTVVNTGRDGGQTVFHLHVHVLAGRPLGWPPG
ncbi:MAG: histidine triad nucleotide-binding protein [Deltaproteobacteria bacterium]|nr:histidine triad nucleotide-binding protein [Deltaproteobacteria bacterium]